jgi:hypothetical protein
MSGKAGASATCPRCGQSISAMPRSCDGCGAVFRWLPAAALMSVVLPGWGHFYQGRRVLAAFELAGALVLFAAACARLGIVFMAAIDERATPLDLLWVCLRWSFVLVCYSVADGAFTLLVSRRLIVEARAQRDPKPRARGPRS